VIADSHCHAWRQWPYDKSVPDPKHRGSAEALLYEMDTNGVARAAVVCARIGDGAGGQGFANEDNNKYVSKFARRFPDRLTAWVDVDCMWRKEHHTPGAAQRLRKEIEKHNAQGFTHYVQNENDGWLRSDAGFEFFATAAQLGVVASLALSPRWLADLRIIARENPTLPILLHHMVLPEKTHSGYSQNDVEEILETSKIANIGVKISGFHYNSINIHDFPYRDSQELFQSIYQAYGAHRLFWGSDFPASRAKITYSQSIAVVRDYCDYIPENDMAKILGHNLNKLLNQPKLVTREFL
jgi:L-fuconolactonase